jgi:phytoene dehydrogenase-like protein
MSRPTVHIIGGGMSGLCAGAVLAGRGFRVHILEQSDKPGGYVTGFWRQGHYFDATGAFLASCRPGSDFYGLLQETGLAGKLTFLPIPEIRNCFPGASLQLPYASSRAYTESLKERFPGQAQALEDYLSLTLRLGRQILAFDTDPLWKKFFLPLTRPLLLRCGRLSHKAVLDRFFDDPRLHLALSALPTTLPPSRLAYAFVAVLWTKVLQDGVFYPQGGMIALSQALQQRILDLGGRIDCNHRVVELRGAKRRIDALKLADGQVIETDWLLGAANPLPFQASLPDGQELFRRPFRLQRFRPSFSALLLYAGLPAEHLPPDWPSFVSVQTGQDQEQAAIDLEGGSLDGDLHAVLTTPSLLDPRLAPPGQQSLKVLVHAPRAGTFAASYPSESELDALQTRILERLRTWTGLDLANRASFIERATPQTLQRRTGNQDGAMYGFDAEIDQIGPSRPPQATRYHNLVWVGHYTRPAHGIVGSGLSGLFGAKLLIKRMGKKISG